MSARSNGGRNNFPVFCGVALLGTPSTDEARLGRAKRRFRRQVDYFTPTRACLGGALPDSYPQPLRSSLSYPVSGPACPPRGRRAGRAGDGIRGIR